MYGDLAGGDDYIAARLNYDELIPALQDDDPFYDDYDLYDDVDDDDPFYDNSTAQVREHVKLNDDNQQPLPSLPPAAQAASGLHYREFIPAIQEDEPFYDDYDDDHYNDVNVGDGFVQALHPTNNNSMAPVREHDELNDENQPSLHLPPPAAQAAAGLHNNELILAIQDDELFNDDYDDPYNDVSFGDGSFHAPAIIEEAITERAPDLVLPSDRAGEAQGRATNTSNSVNKSFVSKGGSFENGKDSFFTQGGGFETEAPPRQGISNGNEGFPREGGGGGLTTLFVGELHWWTTDADVEGELCKYGQVKEVRFFDDKATGKSKGYCQVEFYDPVAAAACAEGMNGHVFNGRPCVAALASHYTIRKMGDAQVNRNRQQAAARQLQQTAHLVQKGRGVDGPLMNGNHGRGVGGGPMGSNGRGPVGKMLASGGRGIINPPPPMLHPGAMLDPGFDPNGFATAMWRMGGGFGGFPAGPAGALFPGMMLSFPPGVAPHMNPALFGRGMPGGGVGMWQETNIGGWRGEVQLGYWYGDNAAPDQHYAEVNQGKVQGLDRERSDVPDRRYDMEKENDHGQEWQGRRYHDEREMVRDKDRDREWERERQRGREKERARERERLKDRNREKDRDMHRGERHNHVNHYRHRDRESECYDDRGRSSRAQSRSREIEHAKRRRLSCE